MCIRKPQTRLIKFNMDSKKDTMIIFVILYHDQKFLQSWNLIFSFLLICIQTQLFADYVVPAVSEETVAKYELGLAAWTKRIEGCRTRERAARIIQNLKVSMCLVLMLPIMVKKFIYLSLNVFGCGIFPFFFFVANHEPQKSATSILIYHVMPHWVLNLTEILTSNLQIQYDFKETIETAKVISFQMEQSSLSQPQKTNSSRLPSQWGRIGKDRVNLHGCSKETFER